MHELKGESKTRYEKNAMTVENDDVMEKTLLLTCDVAVEDKNNV